MQKVLITGGTGFIGRNVAEQLVARDDVAQVTLLDNLSPQIYGEIPSLTEAIFTHPRVQVLRGDVREKDVLKPHLDGVTTLIHFAAETGTAQSMYKIGHYNDVNSQATAQILQTLVDHPHQISNIVLASSRSVYGEGAYVCPECGLRQTPEPRRREQYEQKQWNHRCVVDGHTLVAEATREDDKIRPASIYAATKFAQEDLIRIAAESMGITSNILRFQNVYGEGQSLNNPYTGILSILSTKIRQNMDLPVYEDGLESRDFVHVSDVARAVVSSVFNVNRQSNLINVGSGVPVAIFDVIKLLASAFGYEREPIVTGQYRVGDIRHCFADMTKAREMLDFVPEVSLEEGMRRFVDWVQTQPLPEDKLEKANEELRRHKLMV